mgnify:CR=1 FL=1
MWFTLIFFNGNFKNEFSFFNLSQRNFLKLSSEQAKEFAKDFDKLHKEYYTPNAYRIQILQAFLLSLLFKYKSMQELLGLKNTHYSKKQKLVFQFQNLVSNCFIKHKQVGEYAKRLNVSANTLNQTVKETLGKTAKEVISEKIIEEAKKQLKYSANDISEIAYNIGFDEPTHFIRFFKKNTFVTPKEYRINKITS